MTRTRIYHAIIQEGTYDIMSADTGLYGFITEERLYNTLTELMNAEDARVFKKYTEHLLGESFVIHMCDTDGNYLPFYTTVKADGIPGQLQVQLIDIVQLIEAEKIMNRELMLQGKLLELYGDDLMIYVPETEEIRLVTDYNIAPQETVLSLIDFERKLKQNMPEEKYSQVTGFIAALKNGERYFEMMLEGSLFENEVKAKFSVLKGATVYEGSERSVSVAYIHKAKERGARNQKLEIDSLTGLLGKSAITNRITRIIDVERRQNVSIAIIDIDYFKKVNDVYGHMIGDDVIRKVAAILKEAVGEHGEVGRVGGDEFFVIFYDVYDLENARELLRSIKNNVLTAYPPNTENRPALSVSIGCAAFPKDADNFADLFMLADFALYRAKEKGRNRFIIYDEDKHGSLLQIKMNHTAEERINSRGDMSEGDILCVLMDKVYSSEGYPLENLLDEYINNFGAQRIAIYDLDRAKLLHMVGEQILSKELVEETQSYVRGDFWKAKYRTTDEIIINNISLVKMKDTATYALMDKQGVISCIHIRFKDKRGVNCAFCLESVSKLTVWNTHHMHYYRLMARLLREYDLGIE